MATFAGTETISTLSKVWQPDRDLYESVQKVRRGVLCRIRAILTGLVLLSIKADWADIILDSELKTQIQKEYKSFFKSEAIYKDLGVAWFV